MSIAPLVVSQRKIGPGEPVFVIAEAGINHNGSLARAKKLIEAAATVGADAVKFQKRDLAEVYQQKILADPNSAEQKYQYLIPLLQEFELSDDAFLELEKYANKLGIIFLVNGWDKISLVWLEANLSIPVYKVGSPDMTNDELLEAIAATQKPMLISTGMSQQSEVDHLVELMKKLQVQFALLHTNNTYPAPFDEINLNYLDTLKKYGVPVGYSGHERGIAVTIAAVARGAAIIERHLTIDRNLHGPDHQASLLPEEFKQLVEGIRQVEKSLGDGRKRLTRIEVMNREQLAKSIVAKQYIPDGTVITREMLTTKSPAKGLSPQRLQEVVGLTIRRDLPAGEAITEDDLTANQILDQFDGSSIPWRWGVIVRIGEDFTRYLRYSPRVFEFHLSDKDLDEALPNGRYEQELIVHAPEYMGRLYLNPATEDQAERKIAIDTLQRSLDLTKKLGDSFTGTPKLVIHPGGITLQPVTDPNKLLNIFGDTLAQLRTSGVEILPENLPPRPWVFGGEWVGNIFLLPDEIKHFLDQHSLKMCFDTSHAALACNAAGADLTNMVKFLRPYIRHLHISDAAGIGDEGMQIGEGTVNFADILAPFAGYQDTVVPEIWQGHLHEGKGFLQAMNKLKPYLR